MFFSTMLKFLAKVSLSCATTAAGSASIFISYQPALPSQLMKK